LAEELRRQLAESQMSEDKHRGVVVHLKEQLGEVREQNVFTSRPRMLSDTKLKCWDAQRH
jgi:hypothetical protein